ncbi:PREDICTED: WD repeat-containing protein 90 [Nanorana parkeri]|uniref:WD repeat-containing protein 90 n=1 Tax=Nanorana parkeri TaxID=125878 RepID=UPI00085442F1|nr:PREDICTED: WD repeat-containing protein 90 [Nanorana parkeri]
MAGVWQHPFVNVFKHVRLEEWKRSTKEGDVTSIMDKNLKCTVYKIRGSIPAGNYILLPKTSSQSLGLTGRYLYVLFRPIPGKHFVVHVDVSAEDGQTIRISFSNLFKEFKSTATWLQFPFVCSAIKGSIYDSTMQAARNGLVGPAPSGSRWTCLLLDLQYILSMYLSRRYSHLRSIKLCSSLLVKNLMTSDLVFQPELSFMESRHSKPLPQGVAAMPREMAFPVPKGEKWHDLYDFIRFPSDGSKLPYDSIQKGQTVPTAPGAPLPRSPVRENPRSVTISKPVQDRVSLIQQITTPRPLPRGNPLRVDSIPEHYLSVRGKSAKDQDSDSTSTEEDDGGIHVYAHKGSTLSILRPNADSEQVICTSSRRPVPLSSGTEAKKLLPDPILKLRKIIGFGGCTERIALWTHTGCSVVYPCHAVIVVFNVESGEQRFFMGHTDKVSALTFNGNCTLLASAQTGTLSMVRLWHFQKGSCLAMFKTHAHSVSYLSFSHSGSVLCGVGKDGHGKTMVVVWNTSQASRGGEVVVLAKAHTDVDIQTMKIAFFDDTRMVSCGKDNVRLWRVRSGSLRSCPVNLDEYHTLEFTDLAFEAVHSPEKEPEDRTLYVCSRSGHILEIDYKNMVLCNVRRLQPSQVKHGERREKQTFNTGPGIAINSLSISSTYCATGSEDGYLRLWPLDFSGVFLEAEHEGPVSCVSISPESLSVLSCTRSGELGVLDVPTRGYQTLMRSHTDSLLAFSTHPTHPQIATVSNDNTIRIWDVSSLQQLYDFTANEETPCTVTFHPIRQALACGFSTGVVRYFNVTTTSLQAEHKQHRSAITGLLFSPDGGLMYSACSLGSLALYSIGHKEQHVLRVLGNVVCKNSERGPQALCLSKDGRLLAFVGPTEYTVTIMDARSLDELLRVDVSILDLDSTKLDCAMSLAFTSRRPYHLLVSTSGNKILWLNSKTGRLIKEVSQVHKQYCSVLALSEDDKYLLTAEDRIIKVWDHGSAGTSRPQVFIGHSEPVQQVDFSPNQQNVISAGDAIFIWDFEAAPDPDAPDLCSAPCLPAVHQPGPAGHLPSTLHSSSDLTDHRRESTFISSGMPRGMAPRPCSSSPPRLDISPVQRVETAGLLSESDDGDVELGKVLHEESKVEEVEVQDPEESDGQSSLIIIESQPNRTKLPRAAGNITEDVRQNLPRPDSYSHFNPRYKTSTLAKGVSHPPAGQEMLALKAVIGYNGNGRGNMAWSPDTGFFAYTCGCIVVVEDLHSGSQRHWLGQPEEISTLALTHDALVLASSSGSGDGSSLCQIRIWNTQEGSCTKILQYHSTEVQAMNFSRDDRLLITVGDFRDGKLALWSTRTYELLASSQICQPVHAITFNPAHANSFSCVGTGAVSFWRIEDQAVSTQMKVYRAPVPDEVGTAELTSLTYNPTSLLYTGCSTGQVCVWDTQSHRCFMTWEADQGEIGVVLCGGNRLVTGSNTRRLRLWSVAVVQELREKGSEASSSSVLMEQEMTLDGAVVCAAFDDAMEMGIVGTTAGTLWYINWVENTSIRLISGHRNKVTDLAVAPGEAHCATCGEDGSVRVWSLHSFELLLQFQVLNQSCLCLDWSPHNASGQRIAAGYSDGTIRIFSVSKTEMEMKIHPHPCAVTAIAFSLSGEVLLSGGKDGLMAISSTRTGMTVRVLSDHKGSPITTIQFSRRRPEELGLPGGEVWLASSLDRRVSVWASDWPKDTCELLDWMSFPAPDSEKDADLPLPTLAAFCPWQPGTVVYTGFGLEKEVLFYALAQKQVLLRIPLAHFATSLSMSPAASLLALGSGERLLRVIDTSAGTQQDFSAHDDAVHLCRVSPTGNLLFTASYNQVLVWDIQHS